MLQSYGVGKRPTGAWGTPGSLSCGHAGDGERAVGRRWLIDSVPDAANRAYAVRRATRFRGGHVR